MNALLNKKFIILDESEIKINNIMDEIYKNIDYELSDNETHYIYEFVERLIQKNKNNLFIQIIE